MICFQHMPLLYLLTTALSHPVALSFRMPHVWLVRYHLPLVLVLWRLSLLLPPLCSREMVLYHQDRMLHPSADSLSDPFGKISICAVPVDTLFPLGTAYPVLASFAFLSLAYSRLLRSSRSALAIRN